MKHVNGGDEESFVTMRPGIKRQGLYDMMKKKKENITMVLGNCFTVMVAIITGMSSLMI